MAIDKLTQEEFMEEFKEQLSEALSDHEIQYESKTVHKPNEDLEGLSVRVMDVEGGRVAPTLYPKDLYNDYLSGKSVEAIVSDRAELIKYQPEFDLNSLSAENAKEHIRFSLVSTKENEEWLKTVPHDEIGDISAVPRWHLDDTPYGSASFVINDQMCQHLQLTKEEVLTIARENTENGTFSVQGLSETMAEMMGVPEDEIKEMFGNSETKEPMYVITNESKVDGAAAMLSDSTMQAAHDKIGEDFYVIPSSRHEIIAVPESMVSNPEDIKNMVTEVNSSVVDKADYLSDNVFHYDSIEHELSPVFDEDGLIIEHNEAGLSDLSNDMDGISDSGMGGR